VAQATSTFETGVNGSDILTTDPGSATPWDVRLNAGGGNTITYDNAHAYGVLSGKFDRTASDSAACRMEWTTGIGTLTDWYGRVYIYATANPAGSYRVVRDLTGGSFIVFVTSSGTIQSYDTVGGLLYTTATSIGLNQWVRVEWHWIHSATVGQGELKLFNSPDSSTPTETKTSTATFNTGVNTSNVSFGLSDGGPGAGPIWLDNVVAGAPGYPGPFITATRNLAPVIYGRGAC